MQLTSIQMNDRIRIGIQTNAQKNIKMNLKGGTKENANTKIKK